MSTVLERAGGVVIGRAESERDTRAAVLTLRAVWPQSDGAQPLTPELTWALAHSGNYVATACDETGACIGAAVAFRAHDAQGDYLHSHIAGVLPTRQGSNVGFKLKQHQREWATANGLDRIAWTFDPLVARNAYFNVTKLGARLTRYYVDFYGAMSDGINGNDETDRCLATWWLRAAQARSDGASAADLDRLRTSGAADALVVAPDGTPRQVSGTGRVRLVQVPRDIVRVRQERPAVARSWRAALRDVLVSCFAEGFEVVQVNRDAWYVLAQPG